MAARPRDACPDRDKHTNDPTEPTGYVAWHEWAAWMDKRSRQEQCPTCGCWAIWSPTGEELGFDVNTSPLCLGVSGRHGGGRKAGA